MIGDQSAALVGQNCLSLGDTKATYGTGCFLMQNIGPGPLHGALCMLFLFQHFNQLKLT